MPEVLIPQDAPVGYSKQVINSTGPALFLQRWFPADGRVQAHVLMLHGYMDHGGRYSEIARHLCLANIAVTAVDLRGHGHSKGQRGYIERFDEYLDDIQAALSVLEDNAPHFVLAHSNGALAALKLLHDRRPKLAGAIVTNPFLGQTHPARGLKLWVGNLAGRYAPRLSLASGLKATDLSHDPIMVEKHRRDPLIFTTANAAWFREATAAQEQVRAYTTLDYPLLYVYSDSDPVASPQLNMQLAAQLVSPDKTILTRQNELHEVLHESERSSLHHAISHWLRNHAASDKTN